MVSMSGAMSAGAAGSYYEKDNYYMKGDMAEKGEWFGAGVEQIGKSGEVNINDFKAILHGYDPNKLNEEHIKTLDQFAKTEASINFQMEAAKKAGDNEKILAMQDKIAEYNQLHKEFDKSLPEGAKLVQDGHNKDGMVTHRGAFDITFSAPKSLSIMAMPGGDTRLIDIHKSSVNTAMGYVQDYFAQTRIREDGGRNNVNTGNLTVVQFTHYTARGVDGQKPDPDLHTHNVIMNLTYADGRAMSLEPPQIYLAQKLADQIYNNEVSRQIKEIGYAETWTKYRDNHSVGIKGLAPEVLSTLSKRESQITSAISAKEAELGRELSKGEKDLVVKSTRSDKEAQDSADVRADWDRQLKELGLDREALIAQPKGQVSDKALTSDVREAVNNGTRDASEQKAVFTNHEVLMNALKNDHGQNSLKEIVNEIKSGQNNAVGLNAKDPKNVMTEKYSSTDIIDAEKAILTAIADGKNASPAAMSKENFAAATKGREDFEKLKTGQKESLEHAMTSGDKYIAIVGDSGTGKSTMIGVLAGIVKEQLSDKIQLHGLAPMGTAAAGLEEKGLASQTVDSFLLKAKPEQFNDGKQHIVVVDEVSTLSTEKFNALVGFAEKVENLQMVFMGDDKQMQAVGAGAMFKYAVRGGEIDHAKMTESIRQNLAQEGIKETVEAFKDINRVEEGMQMLKDHGRLIEAEVRIDPTSGKEIRDVAGLKDKFVENLANDIEKRGAQQAMGITYTNAERAELGERTREVLQERGVLGSENRTTKILEAKNMNSTDKKTAMSYEKGDVLINSQKFADMKSKTESRVMAIDKEENRIQVQYENKRGEQVERWIDAEKGDRFNTYREVDRTFNEGERITFTNRDDSIGVKNGEFATIKEFTNNGKIIVEKETNGRLIEIDPEQNRHIDQGMVITPNKSQGMSFESPHIYVNSQSGLNSYNANHVATSRTTDDLKFYTDNADVALEKFKDEQLKENYHDYIKPEENQEIKSAAEPVAAGLEEKSFDDKISDLRDDLEKSIESAKDDFSAKLDALMDNKEISSATEAKIEEMEKVGATERELLNTLDETKDEAKEVEKEVERGE